MCCFISDRTRECYPPRTRDLTLSRIFDGCAGDFKKGCNGLPGDARRWLFTLHRGCESRRGEVSIGYNSDPAIAVFFRLVPDSCRTDTARLRPLD